MGIRRVRYIFVAISVLFVLTSIIDRYVRGDGVWRNIRYIGHFASDALELLFPNSLSGLIDTAVIMCIDDSTKIQIIVAQFIFIVPIAYYFGKYVEAAVKKYNVWLIIISYIALSISTAIFSAYIVIRVLFAAWL
ncbi:MAG: hypothetical protein H7840_00425 [Alphaproteobacteria bacterium]